MYGVVDMGSNSIRLVIFDIEKNQQIHSILDKKYSAGLASYVKKYGQLSDEGIQVAADTLNDIKLILMGVQIDKLYIYATASLRNITNSGFVIQELKERTGFDIRVLSGQEEAFFDYYAVLQANYLSDTLICDIGGGSTEVILMKKQKVIVSDSLPVGSLNMFSIYVNDLIPTKRELNKIKKAVEKNLKCIYIPEKKAGVNTLTGIGGTCRATMKLYRYLYGSLEEHEYETKYLRKVLKLLDRDPQKLMEAILKICPERIHTIVTGIQVLSTIADYYGIGKIVISSYGCREGFLYYNLKNEGVIHESEII